MSRRTIAFGILVALVGASCGTDGERRPRAPEGAGPVLADPSVAHRDPRLDVPSFVWLSRGAGAPASMSAADAALRALPSITRAFAVSDAAAESISLARLDDSGEGPIVASYEQRIGEIEVFRGSARIMMTRALRPVAVSGFLAPTAVGSERPFKLRSADALAIGARALGGVGALSPIGEREGYERFEGAGLLSPARAKRVFFPVRGAREPVELEPAWYVELVRSDGPARGWVVSALDGRVLLESDFVRDHAFSYRVYADPETLVPMAGPQGHAFAPHPTGTPDKQALSFVPSQLVTLPNYPFSKNDPWLDASATTTRGNNVVAYADLAAPDGLSSGDVTPALTEAHTFGHVYDTDASPSASEESIQAATTHLFYVTNFLHDWFYDAGFDEASGNHQADNFGRGGRGRDPLIAEADDYSGRNNANAMVPPDGSSPRIQMFVFSGRTEASLVVHEPASIAGTRAVGRASGFGKDAFETTGPVVLAVDAGGVDPADACDPLENDATGKILLVHRGTCSFVEKAQAAEAAGAIGVIIANVKSSADPGVAPFMGGQAEGITIPVLSLSYADGQAIEQALGAGVSVTMARSVTSDLDGALDTGIIAHEWGHVLSGRLVGDGMGLTTNQAGGLGEGWGDFTALLLTARADDPERFAGAYATGVYATSGSGDDIYYGIRRVPYSIDRAKNALTLKHIQNGVPLPVGVPTSFGEDGSFNAQVHNAGEVWATMLWECYASLLRDSGLSFAEAQRRMKRYLVASLKLTPPDPTFLEARDALLAAALATDERDFKLFFEAFARRGAGAGAVGPAKDSPNNQGVVESFEAGNDLEVVAVSVTDDVISCDHDGVLDEGETGSIEVTIRNAGSGSLGGTTARVVTNTEGVALLEASEATVPPLAPFETATVRLPVRVSGREPMQQIELEVLLSDPALPDARVVRAVVPARYEADERPNMSAIDRVETVNTAWRVTRRGAGERWARSAAAGDGHWTVTDPGSAGDHRLTSPAFTIDGASFTLAFKHKWSLFYSQRRGIYIDGAVVELSVDDGATWRDVSEYGAVDYNATLFDGGGASDNPLRGRRAYGGVSRGYPDEWVTSRIDVTLPEHPSSVRVRFRLGAATAFMGGDGWSIDDIELIGISSTPFWGFVPHEDDCDPDGPTVFAGESQGVLAGSAVQLEGSAEHPEDEPLTFEWSQVAGSAVTLDDTGSLAPSFVAPEVTEPTTLTFALRAHDGALLSAASLVDVEVEPLLVSLSVEGAGCGCRAAAPPRSPMGAFAAASLGVLLARRRRRASR